MIDVMHLDVISRIVSNDVCRGCGVCAGVCPSNALEMTWQGNGDRVPIKLRECPPKCDFCLRVCPFNDQAYTESTLAEERFGAVPCIQHDESVGYYLSAYVGYSTIAAHRSRGSSGGMCTWTLEALLNTGQVDAVACVGRSDRADQLFDYQILEDIEKVRGAASSRYYPVDIADVVRQLQAPGPDKRYAVVGLPCTLKGLQLAMMNLPILRRRVVFLLGLVCGHLPNRHYTEYLARLSGVNPDQLETVDYRLKQGSDRASNYLFRARRQDGIKAQPVPFRGRVSRAWGWGYFQHNACNYCDDIFAETADAVFMDAWLPEYEADPQGHSLIIARHPELLKLLEQGSKERTCRLNPVSINKVAASQKGLVYRKKVEIAGRLYRAERRQEWVPKKRVSPSEQVWHRHRHEIETRYNVQRVSKELWPRLKEAPLWRFHLAMWRVDWPLRTALWWSRLCRLTRNPWLFIRLLPAPLRRFIPGDWQQEALGNSGKEE
jgi:coenzyme F420 hydrogenase subunit beta